MLRNMHPANGSRAGEFGDEFIGLHRPPVAPASKAQLSQSIMAVANIIYTKHVDMHTELFYPPNEEVEESD
jgi:hypothetical protein